MAARKSDLPLIGVSSTCHVAMEPGLGGQEKSLGRHAKRTPYCRSQWSLALAARKSQAQFVSERHWQTGRNGAWPWRPGKASPPATSSTATKESQWSLALAARKRTEEAGRQTGAAYSRNGAWPWRPGKGSFRPITGSRSLAVAMEPGLGGQEKVTASRKARLDNARSQWSLALAARKRLQRRTLS